jgi:uncharacterized protein YjaG (DUF416 family)
MTDSTDDYHFADDYSVAPLIDDCNLLGSLLDDCLKSEVRGFAISGGRVV